MAEGLTWQSTAWDFKAAPPEVALLPLASIEPHGSHLPIGADLILMTALARAVAGRLVAPTYLLPTWPLGTSGHHTGTHGTVSLGFETLWAVVRDVATSLHEHGVHRVAVLNNHGAAMTTTTRPIGNFIVKTAVRQLNYETPGLTAIWVQPFAAAREAFATLFPSAREEVHAGAVETSILMHLVPELVGPRPQDYVPSVRASYLDFAPFRRLAPEGVWGRPGDASPEKGAQALEAAVEATIKYIERTFDQLAAIKGER
ncbi:MAG: creatininase family protein [Ardenticatenaceae bacterium]|nr:creatininase family protein [Ardenticatenaceae bacterium]